MFRMLAIVAPMALIACSITSPVGLPASIHYEPNSPTEAAMRFYAALKAADAGQITGSVYLRDSAESNAVAVWAIFHVAQRRLAHAAVRHFGDPNIDVGQGRVTDAQLDAAAKIVAEAKVIKTGDKARIDFDLPGMEEKQTIYLRKLDGVWKVDLGKSTYDPMPSWNGEGDTPNPVDPAFEADGWLYLGLVDGLNQLAKDVDAGKYKDIESVRKAGSKIAWDVGKRESRMLQRASGNLPPYTPDWP